MSEQNSSTWRRLVRHWTDLGFEVRTALRLRWRLAAAELRADAALLRRAVVCAAIAAMIAAASLPLLPAAVAELLDGRLGWSRAVWLLVLSGGGLAAATLLALGTWIRTRRALVALKQTREELAEDLIWLGEWLGRGDGSDDQADQADPTRDPTGDPTAEKPANSDDASAAALPAGRSVT